LSLVKVDRKIGEIVLVNADGFVKTMVTESGVFGVQTVVFSVWVHH